MLLKLDWTEIARSGWYLDHMPLTHAVFQSMVDLFDPAGDGVPICIGHPWDDAPAWGWVTAIEIRPNDDDGPDEGWSLWMQADADPVFYGMLADKKFKNRSISVDPGAGGAEWRLRHVGFLGAAQPAIAGMEPLRLSKPTPDRVFEFAGLGGETTTQGGAEMKNRYHVLMEKAGDGAGGGGGVTPPAPAPTPAAPAAPAADYSAELASLKTQLAAERAARRLSEANAFCARLLGEARVTPAMAVGLPELLAALPEAGNDFSYSASGAEKKVSPRAFMEGWLAALPPQVALGESAKRAPGAKPAGDFTADLDKKVRALMEKEAGLTYGAAFDRVTAIMREEG